jgi:hypothetical protein
MPLVQSYTDPLVQLTCPRSRKEPELLEQRFPWIDFILVPMAHFASEDTAKLGVFADEPAILQLVLVASIEKDKNIDASAFRLDDAFVMLGETSIAFMVSPF